MVSADKETIIKITTTYLPKATIYLFGSRARQDNSPEADIDIALDIGSTIDPFVLSSIKELIDESTIPFSVDVVDIHTVSQKLKNNILKDGIIWYQPKSA